MKIAYIDGPRLRAAILAGSESIIVNAEGLNAINVFPVPDGDTGTNMASTMRSIAAALSHAFHRDAGSMLKQWHDPPWKALAAIQERSSLNFSRASPMS